MIRMLFLIFLPPFRYSFMSLWQIKSLPVPHLLAPGALVGIWVTNKQKYLRFTKTELFPHRSVELVAEWYWVKVTRRGELVTDLDSPHKKPYEPLLLGRFKAKMEGLRTNFCLSVTKADEPNKEKIEFTCNESELEVLAPEKKRRKIKDCEDNDNNDGNDNDDDIRKTCCIHNKYLATTMSHEWTLSSTPKPKTYLNCTECSDGQLNRFPDTVPIWNPRKHCISCHKNKLNLSDVMESSSDAVVQKEQSVDEVIEVHKSKRFHETSSDLNFVQNVQDTCVMDNTSKHLEPLRRDMMPRNSVLPYHQIICSVPCKIHSRKPPLNGKFPGGGGRVFVMVQFSTLLPISVEALSNKPPPSLQMCFC